MVRVLKFTGFLILALVVSGVVFFLSVRESIPDLYSAQTPVVQFVSSEFDAAIETSRQITATVRQEKFYPSLSVAVYRQGELLWSESIGYADIKNRTHATPGSHYPIGSISKSLTAVAAMRLVEDGRLDLDRSIDSYAPDLPIHVRHLTMRQLLSHQAGVRHYKFAFIPPAFTENGMNREFSTTKDALSIFIDDPLLFDPDTSFQYSTYGYTLTSYVIEQATETPFPTFMKEALLDPLEMADTKPDRQSPQADGRTTDYMAMMRRLAIFQSPETNSSYKRAGGGFLSTPTELARFGDIVLNGSFLGEEIYETMTTARTLTNGEVNPQQYGLGWRVGGMHYPRTSDTIIQIIHHGGTAAGAECALLLTPDFQISVALCGNAFTGGSGDLIQLAADVARNFQDEVIEATP